MSGRHMNRTGGIHIALANQQTVNQRSTSGQRCLLWITATICTRSDSMAYTSRYGVCLTTHSRVPSMRPDLPIHGWVGRRRAASAMRSATAWADALHTPFGKGRLHIISTGEFAASRLTQARLDLLSDIGFIDHVFPGRIVGRLIRQGMQGLLNIADVRAHGFVPENRQLKTGFALKEWIVKKDRLSDSQIPRG